MVAMMKTSCFFFYTYAFLIGSYFVQYKVENSITGEVYTGGDILAVLIALMSGFTTMVAALPNI